MKLANCWLTFGGVMVQAKVVLAVVPPSVTVTRALLKVPVLVGVPLMTPVPGLMESPAGRPVAL